MIDHFFILNIYLLWITQDSWGVYVHVAFEDTMILILRKKIIVSFLKGNQMKISKMVITSNFMSTRYFSCNGSNRVSIWTHSSQIERQRVAIPVSSLRLLGGLLQ
jgi:hypothetical protein